METAERMKLVRMIEKISENKEFSWKIGLKDVSVFQKAEKQKERVIM